MTAHKDARAELMRVLERVAVESNNSYDTLLHAWEVGSQQHTEAKSSQSDLSDAISVLVAERNLARAEAILMKAQLKLARNALRVVALGEKEGTASQISESIKALVEKGKRR